ncbi:MAG: hypothetical protein M1817_001013 [Caeruleum heppii]|nr:MAG: hypothetical protein M1817_001013 [Caeruleum heppii]
MSTTKQAGSDAETSYPSADNSTSTQQVSHERNWNRPDEHLDQSTSTSKHRQHRVHVGKRLSGRPPTAGSTTSLQSFASQSSLDLDPSRVASAAGSGGIVDESQRKDSEARQRHHHHHHHHRHHHQHEHNTAMIAQVMDWVQKERSRRKSRKDTRKLDDHKRDPTSVPSSGLPSKTGPGRSSSVSSDGSEALEQLEQILSTKLDPGDRDGNQTTPKSLDTGSVRHRRRHSSRPHLMKRKSTAPSSDTDYYEGDALVPSCDVVLDNSKTLSYSGGTADADAEAEGPRSKSHGSREKDAWDSFKYEIVRLTHTLRLKGWRRVALEGARDIDVERLSGALTNAVYVVSPPKQSSKAYRQETGQDAQLMPKKLPMKLLLRVYGPQVEHLIDREAELQVLRRLARKKIGPRLLGTFKNGRFEQYFYAKTLTPKDLRNADTSQQIAKRMRELHDGIELLEKEREAGPAVWHNWDKWVDRSEKIISWTDEKIKSGTVRESDSHLESWKERGLVCGVEWALFRRAVEKYREWLDKKYGGPAEVRQRLVFAHNDTQYGNILRLQPSGESPLLLPANEHKQLVVIDFEYASANLPGLEFANHFTEWCYNYHDQKKPFGLNIINYPTVEEQRRFVRSYVEHRSPYNVRPSATPLVNSSGGPSNSISAFMLDSRTSTKQLLEDEKQRDKASNAEVDALLEDTKSWRVANSAHWVAWGVVQAHIPGMEEETAKEGEESEAKREPSSEDTSQGGAEDVASEQTSTEANDEDEFDYLGYAQERALFFWGDMLSLGLIAKEDLPAELLPKLKIVRQ